MPTDLGQFMTVINDLVRRLSPLAQIAEQAGGLFGAFRMPGMTAARPAPAPAPAAAPPPALAPAHAPAPAKKAAATGSALFPAMLSELLAETADPLAPRSATLSQVRRNASSSCS